MAVRLCEGGSAGVHGVEARVVLNVAAALLGGGLVDEGVAVYFEGARRVAGIGHGRSGAAEIAEGGGAGDVSGGACWKGET